MGGQGQLPLNLSGLIIAAMLILAAVLNRPPLESERPMGSEIETEPSGPFEQIPARLWQDPMAAVAEKRCSEAPAAPQASGQEGSATREAGAALYEACDTVLDRYLAYLSRTNADTRLLLMPVMVPGGPYPTDREQRLRVRTAVHAGLGASNFRPLFGNRLGRWDWDGPGGRLPVPFEAFFQDRGAERRVVMLLWVNDTFLSRDSGLPRDPGRSRETGPLCVLDRMLADLGYPQADARGNRSLHDYSSTAVRLIGPAFSDSLEATYVEIRGHTEPCDYGRLDNGPDGRWSIVGLPDDAAFGLAPVNFELISPLATAPLRELLGQDLPGGRVTLRTALNDAGPVPPAAIDVHRTIPTDEVLMTALVDELRLRGVDPTAAYGHLSRVPAAFARGNATASETPRDHIVLISEWDTKYGRTLATLFEDALVPGLCDDWMEGCEIAKPFPWVHRFSYIRGLDGQAGKDAASEPRRRAASDPKKLDLTTLATGETGFLEPAVGTSQYDYLRRLARTIAALDWDLRQNGRGSVKAFGILGTDYYDKLLILQALRERFPSHLYFTTDLDARYLDPKVFRWTRNLIIAAPYDLTPAASARGEAAVEWDVPLPRFRDSLQTSVYLATRSALAGTAGELAAAADQRRALRFEVGYGHFYPLTDSLPPRRLKALPQAGIATPPPARNSDGGWGTGLVSFARSHVFSLLLVALLAAVLVVRAVPAAGARARSAGGAAARWLAPRLGGSASRARSAGAAAATRLAAGLQELASDVWARVGPMARQWQASALARRARALGERLAAAAAAARERPMLIAVLVYLGIGVTPFLLNLPALQAEPLALFGGVSAWPSEALRLIAGLVAVLLLIHGWRAVRGGDQEIADCFGLPAGDEPACSPKRFSVWYLDGGRRAAPPPMGERVCLLFREEPAEAGDRTQTPDATAGVRAAGRSAAVQAPESATAEDCRSAARVWEEYRRHAAIRARAVRVVPAALAFFALGVVVLYGFGDPLTPHRGAEVYTLSLVNGLLLLALPFLMLLFAAWDEALLCGGLVRHLSRGTIDWWGSGKAQGSGCKGLDLHCAVPAEASRAVGHWLTLELIARRTAPAATLIHLPLIVILFTLLSLSTRFDNWETPGGVAGLIGLAVLIALGASLWLRRTAHRIRQGILDDLTEEVSGIRFAKAQTRTEKLEELVERIKAIHEGAYTKWYNEPVIRGLAWVLAVGILVITEYGVIG